MIFSENLYMVMMKVTLLCHRLRICATNKNFLSWSQLLFIPQLLLAVSFTELKMVRVLTIRESLTLGLTIGLVSWFIASFYGMSSWRKLIFGVVYFFIRGSKPLFFIVKSMSNKKSAKIWKKVLHLFFLWLCFVSLSQSGLSSAW